MLATFQHNELGPESLRALRVAISKYFARPYVTGVDIGLKITDGVHDASRGPVVRIHVAEKRSRRTLKSDELIPRRFAGMKTDVVQARYTKSTCSSLAARVLALIPSHQASDRRRRQRFRHARHLVSPRATRGHSF